ncbi:7TM-DISM domain-containing protein [Methylophilus sp. OH31]|uniref:7TM-DISM domain-containing protein n=1 Tax=Methylophilus sp. OH31 TaxID=1387312 RepID=UPI0011DE0596|nr:7TM-DISM domain-containing protein [Methylophilus sp. OH31]
MQRAAFSDSTGHMGIDEVSHQSFKPINQLLIAGYTTNTQWLRITVAGTAEKHLELRIRPTYLDQITLYQADLGHPGKWLSRTTGDRYAYQDRERRHAITHGFVIQGQPTPKVYYLKLKTSSTALMYVEVLSGKEANLKEIRQHVLIMFYLAIMLWLAFWAANEFFGKPEWLTGLFILYQISHMIYAVAIMGYFAPMIPTEYSALNDKFTSIAVLTIVWVSIFFHYVLLTPYQPNRWGMRLLIGLAGFYPVLLLGLFSGYASQVLRLNAHIVLAVSLLLLPLALTARRDTPAEVVPSRRTLKVIYALHTLSLLISILPMMGWSPASEWSLSAILVHSLIAALLMYIVLQQRSAAIYTETTNAKLALQLSQQQLGLERQKRDEMGYFMSMITHELKTPLSVIRLLLGEVPLQDKSRRHMEQSVVDISSMIDRCAQLEKIEQQVISVSAEHCDPLTMLKILAEEYACLDRIDFSVHAIPPFFCDPLMLRLVLRNLLENAFKYAPNSSRISIVIRAEAGVGDAAGVSFIFENDVDSLPDMPQLFDKYYRAPASRKHSGFGIGLYLSRAVAQALGGKLTASMQNPQIRFHLWLPA